MTSSTRPRTQMSPSSSKRAPSPAKYMPSTPLPGISLDVVDESGASVGKGEQGFLVVREPWPSMMRTIWGDDQRRGFDLRGRQAVPGDVHDVVHAAQDPDVAVLVEAILTDDAVDENRPKDELSEELRAHVGKEISPIAKPTISTRLGLAIGEISLPTCARSSSDSSSLGRFSSTVLGRVDDVMNVSGHRLSTSEIESALVSHTSVAEAADQ
jgi:acyl-coenzyme A synthetase/AMP-(fatty) acid ligase